MTKPSAIARRSRLAAVGVGAAAVLLLGACSASGSTAATSTSEAAALPTASAAAARPPAPEGQLPAALQDQLQAALEKVMTTYAVPAAAAGVWIPGEGSWTTAAGLADVDGAVPVTTDMTWPIRSITKSYTVTMLLQLADEGALSLDDTIDQYVDGVTDGTRSRCSSSRTCPAATPTT